MVEGQTGDGGTGRDVEFGGEIELLYEGVFVNRVYRTNDGGVHPITDRHRIGAVAGCVGDAYVRTSFVG